VDTGGVTESETKPERRRTSSGPGKVLVAVYAVFAIAATSRAGVQLATRYAEAPTAYLLSAFAAVIYIVATVTLALGTRTSRIVALVAISIELIGVLAVGILSLADPEAFPRATVWSAFGMGYGFVPLVLPILGLLWLWRTRPARSTPSAQ
jgi:cytochrome bd-type quinol oxidase subunit 2